VPRPFRRATGTVTAFDEARGLGTISTDDGDQLGFHCTAISDGSRTIPVHARVAFTVVAGRLGLWEAHDVSVSGTAPVGTTTVDTTTAG
jgi:cold shock CspA family protein